MKLLLILLLLASPANALTRDSDPILTETLKKEAQGISDIVNMAIADGGSCNPRDVKSYIEHSFKLGYIILRPQIVSFYKGVILSARHLGSQDLQLEYIVLMREHLASVDKELRMSKTDIYPEKLGCSSEIALRGRSAMEYGYNSAVLQMFNYHEVCVRAYVISHKDVTLANEICSQPFTIHE